MLPAPARDDAARFNAQVARLADPARARRLDALEKLWKGKAYDGRPSFWDDSVPLVERGPCVQSSLAETAGRRLVNLVFGNARFPTLALGPSPYGVALTPAERAQLGALVAAVVKAARLRAAARQGLEQALMTGSLCVTAELARGVPRLPVRAAKWCTPTFAADGETLESLDVRYRYDAPDASGRPVPHWYRRTLDAQRDVAYRPVEARDDGREPAWTEDPARTVAHGYGFVPALWHRHQPDPSDHDPLDGTALFAGLEGEIEALDMALSQHRRAALYNGEPQTYVAGADAASAPAVAGETGRGVDPARASWFSQVYDAAGRWLGSGSRGGGAALKKSPAKIWKLKEGSDAGMLESTGAGAAILREDRDALRRVILDARGIVLATPEQVGANASAALLEQLFEPMIAEADNFREEYGPWLVEAVNLLLRVAMLEARRGATVLLPGLAAALPLLARFEVAVGGTPTWVGLPLEPAWGRYFHPTAQDIGQTVDAARKANGDRPVLSLRRSLQLVAPVAGIDDLDAELAAIEAEEGRGHAATTAMLGALAEPAPAAPAEAPPAAPASTDAAAPTDPQAKDPQAALNGAQVTSLLEIVARVAAREIPRETGVALITAAFPIDTAQAEALMGPVGLTFFAAAPAPAPHPFGG